MQTIASAHYIAPTNTRGARISVSGGFATKRKHFAWNYALGTSEQYRGAIAAYYGVNINQVSQSWEGMHHAGRNFYIVTLNDKDE